MKLIQHITVGSGGAASITFSSIPATFTDLLMKFSLRDTGSGVARAFDMQLNGTTITSFRNLVGNSSSASSNTTYVSLLVGATSTSNTFGSGEMYLPNYTSSVNKSLSLDTVTEENGTTPFQLITAALSTVTSAITSITLVSNNSQNFVQHSSATLYGILKGSDGITTAT